MPKKEMNIEGSKSEQAVKGSELDRKIVENLVSLQKVHADLAEKFDKLSDQISSLLNLFETAAKTFTKQPAFEAGDRDREFAEKIDMLLEQNRTLARGISMMEEKIRMSYEQPKMEERIGGSGGVYEQPRMNDNPEADIPSQTESPPMPTAPITQDIDSQSPPAQPNNRPLPRF